MELAQLKQIENIYKGNLTPEEIVQEYEGGDIVPIYTPEQFAEVGTGETKYVAENGKIYTFSTDKTYMFYGEPEDITNVINDAIQNNGNTGSSTEEQIVKILDYEVQANSNNPGAIVGTVTTTDSQTGETTNINIDEYKELIVSIKFTGEFITTIPTYGMERLRVKVPILKDLRVATTTIAILAGHESPVGLIYHDDGRLGAIIYVHESVTYRYQIYGVK